MPSVPWGYIPDPQEAWDDLRSRLEGAFPGQFYMGAETGGGRRQIHMWTGQDIKSTSIGYDPQTGMHEFSGRYAYPTPGYEGLGGTGGALSILGRLASGYDPASYEKELVQNDPYSPYIYQRRSMFSTDYGLRGFTGGQTYAPWTAQQSTMRFMGTMGTSAYTDVNLGLERATPGTHFLPSGLNRRAWAEGFGALGSSMHAMYGTMPGFDIGGTRATLPYRDVKMRERQDLISPGRMPWLYGGQQTTPMMTGRYPGVEQRQALNLFTEFIPGGIFGGAGQSYMKSSALQGVEQSLGSMQQMEMGYSALQMWATGGTRPLGSLYGETLGVKQRPGIALGSFAGVEFNAPPVGRRGLSGYEPMGGRIMLPYGPQLGSLMRQYNPGFFSGSQPGVGGRTQGAGIDVGGVSYGAQHLMSMPGSLGEIEAYERLLGRAMTPDVQRRMGGGLDVYGYMPTTKSAQPYVEWGGQEYWKPQSGFAAYTPGLKSAVLGMQNLQGMASDPRTQFVVGGESVKSMQFIMGGLAQTLPQQAWQQWGVGPENFTREGRLQWYGQPEVEQAMRQMFDPANFDQFQQSLQQAGGFMRSAWRQFPQSAGMEQRMDPGMRYQGGDPQQGQWRVGPQGQVQQFLQSIGFRQPITPIDPYRGGTTGLSFNDMMEIARFNPQAMNYLAGDPEKRGHYGNIMRAAIGDYEGRPTGGLPANLLETARGIASSELSAVNPEWGARAQRGDFQPPAKFLLQALAQERPGQFTQIGHTTMAPAESILATQGAWGPLGQPVSPYARKAGGLIMDALTGAGAGAMAVAGEQFQETRSNWLSQQKPISEIFRASMPESWTGRALYGGGGGLPPGEFAMALPGNFQGQIDMTGEDLLKMMRWPSDVIPDAANVVGRGFSTAQYNKWAGPQGYATIDPKMQQFGTATLFGDIEGLADITQVDMDRDVIAGLVMRNAAGSMGPADLRPGAQRAISRLGGFSKSADAHQFLGMGVSQFVQERMMSTQASTSDIRAQAGRSAIAKGRIGMASNLMDLMKYYSEADRAGMTGGARDLASQAQFDAWSLMGAVKQGYTDQWPNIMDISEQTASDYFMPMNLSGFRGARNRPGAFTRQVPGRMDIEGRVSGARRGIGAGEVFPTFARAAATFGSQLMSPEILQSALAGMFGGYVEGGQIQGMDPRAGQFLSGLAAGEDPQSPAWDVGEMEDFMRTSGFGRMVMGRTAFQAQREAAAVTGESPAWAQKRAGAIQAQLPGIAGLGPLMAEYSVALASTQVGRKAGAIAGVYPGGGLGSPAEVWRAMGGTEAVSGVYDDVRALYGIGGRPTTPGAPPVTPAKPIVATKTGGGDDIFALEKANQEAAKRAGVRPVYNAPMEGEGNTGWATDAFGEALTRAGGDVSKISVGYVSHTQYAAARRAAMTEEGRRGQTVEPSSYKYTKWGDDIAWQGFGPFEGAGGKAEEVIRASLIGGGPPSRGGPPGGGRFFDQMYDDRMRGLPWGDLAYTMRGVFAGSPLTASGAMDWVGKGGAQVMDPMALAGIGRTIGTGMPLSPAQAKQVLGLSRKTAMFGGDFEGKDQLLGSMNAAWGAAYNAQMFVQPSAVDMAWQGGLGNMPESNIAMMRAGVSKADAMSIDRAMIAQNMMAETGYMSMTQKGQMMGAWGVAAGMGLTGVTSDIESAMRGARMTAGGVIPKVTGEQTMSMAMGMRQAEGGAFKPDLSGSIKEVVERFQSLSMSLDRDKELRDAIAKVDTEQLRLKEMVGPKAIGEIVSQQDILMPGGGLTPSNQELLAGRVRRQQGRLGDAQARLGMVQGAQEMEAQIAAGGGPGFIDQARAGVENLFRGGSKFMSFFDLMYMRRVGQIFYGGMEAAGQQVAQADLGMAQMQFATGGGFAQPSMAGVQAQMLSAQQRRGRAFNEVWGPALGAMGGAGGAFATGQAIAGPAMAGGLLANYFGAQWLGLSGSALTGFTGAAALGVAGIGAASWAYQQSTAAGNVDIGTEWGRMIAEQGVDPWQQAAGSGPPVGSGFATLWNRVRGGAGRVASWIRGEGDDYSRQQEEHAAYMFAASQQGFSSDVMQQMSPAQRLSVSAQRGLMIAKRLKQSGIEVDDDTARAIGVRMTQMIPDKKLSAAQEEQMMTAYIAGGDPLSTAAAVNQALTGKPFIAGQTPIGNLAAQMSESGVEAAAQAMLPFGAGAARTMWGMGFESQLTSDSLQIMADMGWGEREQMMWGDVAGVAGGMAGGGLIDEAQVQRLLGYGLEGEWVEREFTPAQQRAAQKVGRFAPGMMAQGQQGVIEAMAAQVGVSGAEMPISTELGGMMQRWSTSAYGRSVLAQQIGMPQFQTLQTAPGFGQGMPLWAASPLGGGMGMQDWIKSFGGAGAVSRNPYMQAFLGQTQVSATTGEPIGGQMGMSYLQEDQQMARAEAGLGIQSALMALRRQYTTGEGMPGGRGFWQIEDDMVRLGRQQGQYNWMMAGRRMDLQVAQFNETWNANLEQFQTRTSWQREDFATQAQKVGMQRSWAREDWAQASQVREMQWGWQQEDFAEDIRFATGRQRRRMTREQERATTMHNIEGEQIDREQGRQEEMWAMQDEAFERAKARHEEQVGWQEERFERQKRYFDEGMELSREQHEMSMKFMQRRWALEDEQRKMQREYMLKQMDLQAAQTALAWEQLQDAKDRKEAERAIKEEALKKQAAVVRAVDYFGRVPGIVQDMIRRAFRAAGGGGNSGGGGVQENQVGFSGLVMEPTQFLVSEGRSGAGGAPEYVSVHRQGSGGIPEAMGQRDGGAPINVTVLIDGEEVAAKVMLERGNNLRVEAYR